MGVCGWREVCGLGLWGREVWEDVSDEHNQYLEIRDQRFGLPFDETDLCIGVVWSCGAGFV